MAEYVLNRNYTLRTLMGHSIEFKKGEPTFVPRIVEKDALAIGALPVDGETPNVLMSEELAPRYTPDEQHELMIQAFEQIVARNDSKDFTGSGVPSVKAVERVCGFSIDRADLNAAWAEFKVSKV